MKSTAIKLTLNTIGALCVVLAIFGVFLPLLPTTPFLLLASACFARGSTRLHGWLVCNKLFGPYLRDFEAGKGIPRRAKCIAIAMLWASLGWSSSRVGSMAVLGVLAATGIAVSIYLLLYVPTRAPGA